MRISLGVERRWAFLGCSQWTVGGRDVILVMGGGSWQNTGSRGSEGSCSGPEGLKGTATLLEIIDGLHCSASSFRIINQSPRR